MKRTLWIVLLIVIPIAGVWAYLHTRAAAAAPELITSAVTRGAIVAVVDATGTLQPVDTVEVGTQVTGTIQTLRADFNSEVRKGAVIATLDPAVLESQVAQAEATVVRLSAEVERAEVQVKDAEQKLARARALDREQLVARADLDAADMAVQAARAGVLAARAQLGQAQAALDQSRVNLSHTIIRAPADGVVLSRNVEVGQTVSAGLQAPTLYVIARDLTTMQLNAAVDEADIGNIREGQHTTFTVDAYRTDEFSGTVRQVRLQPTVSQNVVSYTVVIDVPNRLERLKPGMTATVRIETARVEDVVRLPASALRYRPTQELLAAFNGTEMPPEEARTAAGRSPTATTDERGPAGAAVQSGMTANRSRPADEPSGNAATVWRLSNGRLEPVRVRVGLSDGTHVEMSSGPLEPGAPVVTGVASGSATPSATASSPLLPSMPRRGPSRGTSTR